MKLLALDTTSQSCSVALYHHGEINDVVVNKPRQHAELILDMVDTLLKQADISLSQLDGIAFGKGPGSFTGLRIAASVTQGLAVAYDLPVIPVSSLCAVAQGVYRLHGYCKIYVLFDARMQEVYMGQFSCRDGQFVSEQPEMVIAPERLSLDQGGEWVLAGNAWQSYHALLKPFETGLKAVLPDTDPLARDIAILATTLPKEDVSNAVPTYLRDNVTRN